MAAAEKTVSALINSQLPDFINANHPQFKRFIELYYQWLETNESYGISNTAGNTIYHAMAIENYRDIDQTPSEFITYFKEELLPHFPENPALDITKLLKSAREYYNKKGSEESLKWLFKALYDLDIEVNYPKEQILIASDGKWKKPRAFRITVGESNKNVDVNLLEKRLVVGVDSGATCIVESANRTVDETNGKEVIEIYISNITKYFNNGENIRIEYFDENNVAQVFIERIIGTLSNIRVDSNQRNDPSQRRRGLLYNVGDPVVITGGLGTSAEANDAAAIVGNVTRGSIEAVTPTFLGYGYRSYENTQIIVLRTLGLDDDDANSSTDLRVLALNTTACTSNSQRNYAETITYDKTVIEFSKDVLISSANFQAMTPKNRNVVLDVTEDDYQDYFENFELVWADGTNITDANFIAKVATPNGNTVLSGTVNVYSTNGTVWGSNTLFTYQLLDGQTLRVGGVDRTISSITNNEHLTVSSAYASTLTNQNAYRVGPFGDDVGSDATDDIVLYDVEFSGSLNDYIGETLVAANSGKTWIINSVTNSSLDANTDSLLAQALDFQSIETGGIAAITVIDGGFGFRAEPTLKVVSHYDTDWSEDYDYDNETELDDKLSTWQDFKDLGLVAHVWINNGGSNYSVGDGLIFVGRGYNANGYVQSVNISSGAITSVILDNRGEGYLGRPEVYVNRASKTFTTLTGTALVNNESKIVTGTSTNFTTALNNRNVIKINNEERRITSIANSTSLTVNSAFTANATGQTIYLQDGEEAVMTAYLAGDGFTGTVDTSAIGRVQDIRLLYRGYDYVSTPIVSLKVVDTVINPLPESEQLIEQEYVYQGASFETSTFRANVKSYSRSTNLVRLYNYSGSIDTTLPIKSANSVSFTVDVTERVPVPVRGVLIGTGPSTSYPEFVADLPNPMYYGNGRARAIAQFANGLIEFNGFYLNSDGFPSADKVLQDDKLYHGFSYIIQAEKDLIEYESTVKNITHPAGMVLSAKRIAKNESNAALWVNSNADVFLSTYDSSRIAILNSRSNVVTGYGTDFTNSNDANTKVNVGDLIVISTGGAWTNTKILTDTSLRSQVKEVNRIVSATELEVKGDFVIAGQGKVSSNVLYAAITGNANTNPAVSGTVTINPGITGTANVNHRLTGTVNVLATNVVVGNNNTLFTTELLVNDIITVNNQTRLVVNITNNKHLYVNSAFSYAGNDNVAYLSNTLVIGVGTSFDTELAVGNEITINNERKTIFSIANDTLLTVNTAFLNHANTQVVYLHSNVVTGSGTNFNPQVNVGDIITVNNEVREVTVVTSDTILEVNSVFDHYITTAPLYKQNSILLGLSTTFTSNLVANDIIKFNGEVREVITVTDATHLTVNAPFLYTATDKPIYKLSNTNLAVTGNTNAISDIIIVGDVISINVANSNIYKAQTGTIQYFAANAKIVGTSTNFGTGIVVGDYVQVNNEIKQVVNIASSTVMNVNSAFAYAGSGDLLYKRAGVINANAVSITGNHITLNTAIEANTSGLVWLSVPNYALAINLDGTVNITSGSIYITGNTTAPNVTYFVDNVAVGMTVTVNNETKTIVSIANNSNLTVDSAWTYSAIDKYIATNYSYDYKVLTLTKDLG